LQIDYTNAIDKALQKNHQELIGVGVTAFSKIVPHRFSEDYRIIAYRDSLDAEEIRRYCPVHSLQERNADQPHASINTAFILLDPYVQNLLGSRKGEVCLLVYQSYPELEELARRSGWRILASPSDTRRRFEDKAAFRQLLRELGLPSIPGETIPIQSLSEAIYGEMVHRYGERLVLQLPDIKRGGGRGTFFVDSIDEFRAVKERLQGGSLLGEPVRRICMTRRLSGIPASIAGCQTRRGTLVSALQAQLIDIPDVLTFRRGGGFFCGHDWHLQPFSKGQQQQAARIAKTIGQVLQSSGYRGIFGLDFLADEKGEWLFPIECNPRYTGAFPMISLLHLNEGVAPLDFFHIMEFLDGDYEFDPDRQNHEYQKAGIRGSHLILFSPLDGPSRVDGHPRSGCFRLDDETGHWRFLHPGLDYQDLPSQDDLLVTDGLPAKGKLLMANDELFRICRLLFSGSIAETPYRLGNRGKAACRWVYENLAITSTSDMPTQTGFMASINHPGGLHSPGVM
jgi:hypothetical protein